MISVLYGAIGFFTIVLSSMLGPLEYFESYGAGSFATAPAPGPLAVALLDDPPTLCGAITESTVLSPDSGPYVVTCTVSIGSGIVVTVTPGTILKFNQGTALWVTGVLNVEGTDQAGVYFTSLKDDIGGDTNGDGTATTPIKADWQNAEWGGVVVYGSGALTMTHAHVLYGNNQLWGNVYSQYAGMVLAENAHATLTDSSVRYAIYGINMASLLAGQTSHLMATRLTLADNIYGLTTIDSIGSYVVSMTESIVRNNHTGLVFQGDGNYQVSQSSIDHNSHTGFLNTNPSSIDVRNNWWGHANGPLTRNNPNLYGEYVRGPALVYPWLTASTDGAPDNPMQPIQATPGGTSIVATWTSSNTIWTKAGNPYVIRGDVVFDNADLFVMPGVVIKLEPEGKITPWFGNLNVLGTAAEPVVFTSIKDDTVAGDTNGDGSASQPQPGDWYCLCVTGTAYLQYTEIRYGGRDWASTVQAAFYAGFRDAHNRFEFNHVDFRNNVNAIYLVSGVPYSLDYLKIVDSTIENNQASGLWVQGNMGGTVPHYIQVTGSVFRNNASGILYESDGSVEISESTFAQNRDAGITNLGVQSVDARNNWWDDPSGPFHATLNPIGLGDAAVGNVLLDPWLATEQSAPGIAPPLEGMQILNNPSWEAAEDPKAMDAWHWQGINGPDDCFAWTYEIGNAAGPPADGSRFLATHRKGGTACTSFYQDVERYPQPGETYTFEIAARAPDDLPAHVRRFDLQLFAHDGAGNVQAGERKSFTVLQNQWSRHRVSITISDAAYRYVRVEVDLVSEDTQEIYYNFDAASLVGPPRSSIFGRVMTQIDKPVAGVVVTATMGGISRTSRSNDAGEVSWNYLALGQYRLDPSGVGLTFEPSFVDLSLGTEPVNDLVLRAIDTAPPQATIVAPVPGSDLGPGPTRVVAEAGDFNGGSGIDRVEFYADYDGQSHFLGSTTSDYTVSLEIPPGLHSQKILLAAYAYDNAGNRTSLGDNVIFVNYLESKVNPSISENWIYAEQRAYLNQLALRTKEGCERPGKCAGAYQCSTATVTMILAMNRLVGKDFQSMSDKAYQLYGKYNDQAYLESVLQKSGLAKRSAPSSWDDVVAEIDANRPLLLVTPRLGGTGHWVVIVGYREEVGKAREIIAYDSYGRWRGGGGLDYDVNSNDATSARGRWVYYSFDTVAKPGSLLMARPLNIVHSSKGYTAGPSSPPDVISTELPNLGEYPSGAVDPIDFITGTFQISGVVTLQSGQVLAGASVTLSSIYETDTTLYSSMTDANGRYLIADVKPGYYHFTTSRADGSEDTREITVTSDKLFDISGLFPEHEPLPSPSPSVYLPLVRR